MTFENPKTITIDGAEYDVAGFSETVQRLVTIHTSWRNELAQERLDVAKTEAAIRTLDVELSQTVAKELEAMKAQNAPAVVSEETPVGTPAPGVDPASV
jgi:hypothetical protein